MRQVIVILMATALVMTDGCQTQAVRHETAATSQPDDEYLKVRRVLLTRIGGLSDAQRRSLMTLIREAEEYRSALMSDGDVDSIYYQGVHFWQRAHTLLDPLVDGLPIWLHGPVALMDRRAAALESTYRALLNGVATRFDLVAAGTALVGQALRVGMLVGARRSWKLRKC